MTTQNRIKFNNKNKTKFFETVKSRVDAYFSENKISKHANTEMVIKSIVLLTFYFLPIISLIIFQPSFGISLILWSIMGLATAGIGMSVMHDANHGAYSKNDKVNKIMGTTINFLGGSIVNWKIQHNILHHTFTNIVNVDEDINGSKLLSLTPHEKVKKFHAFQWIYAFFLYGIMTLYWVTVKDFVQFFNYNKKGLNSRSNKGLKGFFTIIRGKLLYFSIIIFIPILAGIPVLYVLAGFFLMHFITGFVLTVIFQLAHTVEGTSHPLPDDKGNIDNEWAIHQMNTTVNFSRNNRLISWYVGGLNYQVEHHLFPKVCHVHYPKIAPIVEATAKEFEIPYLENKTFFKAIKSHLNALKKFGRLPGLNDAIG